MNPARSDSTSPAADARRARAALEAASWVVRFEAARPSADETREFLEWLRESPIHVAEALRMTRLERALGEYGDWGQQLPAAQAPEDQVVPISGTMQIMPSRSPRRHATRLSRYISLAAAVTVIAVALLLLRQFAGSTTIASGSQVQRDVTLSDGSVARLEPSTELRVEMKPHLRSVTLERGEAQFHVAKDPSRPFVVRAEHTEVTAVGTIFTVARHSDGIMVTVTEGHVAVAPNVSRTDRLGLREERTSISLKANESITISSAGNTSSVRTLQSPTEGNPKKNQIFFDHARVADVVTQFNQHNRVQIRVTDPELEGRMVSGIFDADDPRSFADFLSVIAGAARPVSSPDQIVVAPAASAPEIPSR